MWCNAVFLDNDAVLLKMVVNLFCGQENRVELRLTPCTVS